MSGPASKSANFLASGQGRFRSAATRLWRMPSVRYSLLALAALAVIIAAMTQMASVIVDEWSQRDIELRARLVYRSIQERVATGLAAKPESDLEPFFEQLVEDERLLALGFCSAGGKMLYATKEMPSEAHCPKPPLPKVDTFKVVHGDGPPIALALFPLPAKEGRGFAARRPRSVVHRASSARGRILHGARPHRRRRRDRVARDGDRARLVQRVDEVASRSRSPISI